MRIISDILLGLFFGSILGILLSKAIMRFNNSIIRHYYISLAVLDNGAMTVARTNIRTQGSKITMKNIIELEQECTEEHNAEGILIQNIILLDKYINFKYLFNLKEKTKEQQVKAEKGTTKQNKVGPRLMK